MRIPFIMNALKGTMYTRLIMHYFLQRAASKGQISHDAIKLEPVSSPIQ